VFGETVGDSLEPWVDLAREGALLQRELVDHVDEIEQAGCTRLGPAEASTYVATRIEQYAALPDGDRRRLTTEQAEALVAMQPDDERWANQLLSLGLPLSLNHSDLHEHNVFAVGDRLRFFDFGDAVVSDPLSVLLTTLRVLRQNLDCAEDDPRVIRVADSALEVWSDLAPAAELRAALPAALELGKLARSESWVRCLPSADDEEDEQLGDAATYWLRFLAASPLAPFD
jgi:Ser/Thr protein kinase RdoA (MazF antagonist)